MRVHKLYDVLTVLKRRGRADLGRADRCAGVGTHKAVRQNLLRDRAGIFGKILRNRGISESFKSSQEFGSKSRHETVAGAGRIDRLNIVGRILTGEFPVLKVEAFCTELDDDVLSCRRSPHCRRCSAEYRQASAS